MIKKMMLGLLFVALTSTVQAGSADVVGVEVKKRASGRYTFKVTVNHTDQGWEHYADRWEVALSDGMVLATRVLHHPHEGQLTFTRSLHGVEIPPGTSRVLIRAHDNVHGYGEKVMEVKLPE